jgi:diaminohydroxyphosphoribosylaminopyrimidine deaminase/5-amino-6-(5-phosphoribosylamino)uracil reductase
MRAALGLARRGLGNVWPNPAVGCILMRDGRVAGRGWTQPGGRPHAEAEALGRAGQNARGATAYITLEPCSHQGQTAPCVEALLEAGIARAVIACQDPDPRVSGRGIARLGDGGVEVTTGPCAAEAEEINAGFFLRVRAGRPLVTLKVATSLDGRIAIHDGESKWITGETARAWAHRLRACHDAVMVGIGTALADDPKLTCRLPGLAHRSPVRVVVDSRLRLPLSSQVVAGAREPPTWLITRSDGDERRRRAYAKRGVEVITIDADDHLPMLQVVQELGRRGVTRLLVEGGSHIAAALLRQGLVDRLAWFRAPRLIGGDGVAAAAAFGVDRLEDMARFERISVVRAGEDILETYRRLV